MRLVRGDRAGLARPRPQPSSSQATFVPLDRDELIRMVNRLLAASVVASTNLSTNSGSRHRRVREPVATLAAMTEHRGARTRQGRRCSCPITSPGAARSPSIAP
jgi:hypothetical protein